MRAALKRAAEHALVATGAAALFGRAGRSTGLVLAYHNVVPHGEMPGGDGSLHLSQRDFSAQLDILQRHADVVPLTELMTSGAGGPRSRVAITFDDAYRGAVTVGIEELRARGLAATLFVSPAFVGGRSFWWDAAADPGSGLSPAARGHALDACAGQDAQVRRWAASTGMPLHDPPPFAVAATTEELQGAATYGGLTLGSHTWSHPNLTRLSDAELQIELTRPLGWLREQFPRIIPWLTYPYGLSDARVERAAEAAGYDAALRVDGGWLGHSPARFSLPRFNVPAGISPAGFRLRLAGLFCR